MIDAKDFNDIAYKIYSDIELSSVLIDIPKETKVLLVKSVKTDLCKKLIDMLKAVNADIDLVCNTVNDYNADSINNAIIHDGKFTKETAFQDLKQLDAEYDFIIYPSYSLNRESYLNVEEYCKEINNKLNSKIICYDIGDDHFYLMKDITRHILALKAYCSFMYYWEYIAEATI